jgi:hypothetical protein
MSARRPHENIRLQVIKLLKGILTDIIKRRYEVSKDLHSYMLLKLIESSEGITIIMPQEVYVGGERKAIDMALGVR